MIAKDCLIDDENTKKLKPYFEKAASLLSEAVLSGKKILVNYHDDADGLMSGLIMWRGLKEFCNEKSIPFKVNFIQARNVVYRVDDALDDSSYYDVVVLTDLGSGSDSEEAVKLLINNHIQVLIIDHHPMKKVEGAFYVSPFILGDDLYFSNYSAGYLCFEVVRRMAVNENLESFAWIALEGDYSIFRKGVYSKEVDVITYIRYSKGEAVSLGNYERTLNDKSKVSELSIEAREKLESAYKKLVFDVREGFLRVVVTRFNLKGYPSRPIIINFIKDDDKSDKPSVFIIASDTSISFRVNKKALDAGFKSFDVIDKIKGEFQNPQITGGGHAVASGLIFPIEFEKVILKRVVELCLNFKG